MKKENETQFLIDNTLIRETHYPNLWRIPHKDWG